jgi:chromosome segregation ATPase
VTNSTVFDSATKDEGWTASIIPFPARMRPAQATSQDRLVRALASLQAALEDQRIAVAAWREVLAELKTSTAGLHDSLKTYRTNLQTLGASVSVLRDKAQSLEAWADTVTAANPD